MHDMIFFLRDTRKEKKCIKVTKLLPKNFTRKLVQEAWKSGPLTRNPSHQYLHKSWRQYERRSPSR